MMHTGSAVDAGETAGAAPRPPAERRRHGFRHGALWLLGVLVVVVFAAEAAIMLVLGHLPLLPTSAEAMVDAAALALLTFPAFYFVVFRPLTRALNERAAAERLARRRLAELEQSLADLKAAQQQSELAQAQLLRAEKMASIGQLSAGIAHEINNPVGYVSSNLHTLRRYVEQLLALVDAGEAAAGELATDSPARVRLDAAHAAADLAEIRSDIVALLDESDAGIERVQRIARDVKRLAHPGDGEFKPADLNACVESTLTVVWNELKYKAEVVRRLGDLPPVRCLADQISQVLVNLLVNAAHAIETRGVITVVTRQDGDWAVIEVSDTGSGIPPELQQRIFEPFFTTKPIGQGTGLGLSIASKILHNHAGDLTVHSVPGEGSRFTLRLPIAGPPAGATEGPVAGPVAAA